MKIIEKQTRIVDTIQEVLCDCCGNSCKTSEGIIDNPVREDHGQKIIDNPVREDHGQKYYCFEYMTLNATWGYESGKDCQRYSAQVCEKCVDEKLSFIKFKKTRYHPLRPDIEEI